jgi:hypothetical protein
MARVAARHKLLVYCALWATHARCVLLNPPLACLGPLGEATRKQPEAGRSNVYGRRGGDSQYEMAEVATSLAVAAVEPS